MQIIPESIRTRNTEKNCIIVRVAICCSF